MEPKKTKQMSFIMKMTNNQQIHTFLKVSGKLYWSKNNITCHNIDFYLCESSDGW